MENCFISVKRNPTIKERLHYISEAVKIAYRNPNSHNVFDAVASPLYLIGSVYDNFETEGKIGGEFCLLEPDKFDGIYREFWKLYDIRFDLSAKNVKFVDV